MKPLNSWPKPGDKMEVPPYIVKLPSGQSGKFYSLKIAHAVAKEHGATVEMNESYKTFEENLKEQKMTEEQAKSQAAFRTIMFCLGGFSATLLLWGRILYVNHPDTTDGLWPVPTLFGCIAGTGAFATIFYHANKKWLMRNKKASRFSQTLTDEQGKEYHIEGGTAKEIDPNKVRIQPGIRARWVVVLMLLSSLATHTVNHGVKLPFSIKIERR